MAELTTQNFKKILKEELEQGLDRGFEKQAVMINSAFQDQKDHFDKLIADLRDDLKGDITRIETKLDRALYTELIHLESRVKRVEQKLGIKPAA